MGWTQSATKENNAPHPVYSTRTYFTFLPWDTGFSTNEGLFSGGADVVHKWEDCSQYSLRGNVTHFNL